MSSLRKGVGVDTPGMDEFELDQLRRNPKWAAVLNIYQQLQLQGRERQPDFDGWVPRVHEAGELPSTDLPGIHGKLIAFGFLKFDLAGRDGGIRYQLTPLGKQGINSSIPADDDAAELIFTGREEVVNS